MDEGIIKFQANWRRGAAFDSNLLQDLVYYRQLLYDRELIGIYPNGIGYGNISRRIDDDGRFFISGSGTGGLAALKPEHFSRVTAVVAAENRLDCEGPIIASSESMSHSAFYELSTNIGAVIHVHNG
ncbi:MAG: class II aldolase/adducin family protein, partial [Phaeodactylibacter sp.]|nr:class II aldolase/adducin family protein [Phaeodactylibacter sp.]